MEAVESIVVDWLHCQGYFTIPNLRVGNREIDILAVKVSRGKITQAIHVECQVSENPVSHIGFKRAGRRTPTQLHSGVKRYVKNKFLYNKTAHVIQAMLGRSYDKWVVLGNLRREEQAVSFKKLGVRVFRFWDILRGLKRNLQIETSSSKRFLQILKLLDHKE